MMKEMQATLCRLLAFSLILVPLAAFGDDGGEWDTWDPGYPYVAGLLYEGGQDPVPSEDFSYLELSSEAPQAPYFDYEETDDMSARMRFVPEAPQFVPAPPMAGELPSIPAPGENALSDENAPGMHDEPTIGQSDEYLKWVERRLRADRAENAAENPTPYPLIDQLLGAPPPASPWLAPTPWNGEVDTSLTLSGNCPPSLSSQDMNACIETYTAAMNPSFEERWQNLGVPWQQQPQQNEPSVLAEQQEEIDMSAASRGTGQWGFDISDEERIQSDEPPMPPKGASVSQKNELYYGWLFGTKLPFEAKNLTNQAFTLFGLRDQ